jgi:hypothetical protein
MKPQAHERPSLLPSETWQVSPHGLIFRASCECVPLASQDLRIQTSRDLHLRRVS